MLPERKKGRMMDTIRSLQSGELELLKSLRLTALRSDPQAYWETSAATEAHDHSYWANLALELTRPVGSQMFILEHGSHEKDHGPIGFVFGIHKPMGDYRVGGLWVDPDYRRQGYGSMLVQQVVTWAQYRADMTSIRLWTADALIGFYKRNGFISLDRTQTHPSDGREFIEMEWCV
jgi:GNAT superfamily N-acetyltransferase